MARTVANSRQPVVLTLGNVLHRIAGTAAWLHSDEDRADFQILLEEVTRALKPSNAVQQMWVFDIAKFQWEALRLGALKAAFLMTQRVRGLEAALEPLLGTEKARAIAHQWQIGAPEATAYVDDLVADGHITWDAIDALTLTQSLDSVERLDKLQAEALKHCERICREMDRNRHSMGADLWRVESDINDVDATNDAAEISAPAGRTGSVLNNIEGRHQETCSGIEDDSSTSGAAMYLTPLGRRKPWNGVEGDDDDDDEDGATVDAGIRRTPSGRRIPANGIEGDDDDVGEHSATVDAGVGLTPRGRRKPSNGIE